ncbi:DUF389 domain-containing protein [uncultured Polaribacter sp.]|uniref:DUF389 domain-containing protein n=1 Tax=uncultured Polaribacter sp. TaxID=174711 RepID=UPI00262E8675|nr:DUF389 domain-containing protein [uncultured Polaribacter sp.]
MEEDIKKDSTTDSTLESKQNVHEDAVGLFESLKIFLTELFDFRDDTDHEATVEAIKADIPFKGATAWILIFAVFVASIGLNANSTAVVIGAMLISPLMGPILGIGMSFALNDIDTFKKSLINLSTMIVLSLLASFVYFYFFPGADEATSELLGRTKPDIRDVLIAFFGGLALMVARTKKGTIASVIFGVAIATALMPPLCTAGFGLAKWFSGEPKGLDFALGAMFLFVINTIFIALATFIVLKFLRFPMHKYANAARRKRFSIIATILGVIVMIPAVYTFINALNESKMTSQVNIFIKQEVETIKNFQLIDRSFSLEDKVINLSFFNEVTEGEENILNNQLVNDVNYANIKDFKIQIKGSDTKSFELITTAYKEKREELQESKNIISGLQKQISDLQETISSLNNRIEQDALNKNQKVVAFSRIAKEAKIRYNDIQQIGFASVLSSKDFIEIDTIPVATIKWSLNVPDSVIVSKEKQLRNWLQKEMNLDTLFIKREK